MKRAIWIVACAFLAAGSVGAVEPEGFGDLRWGDTAPKGWKLTKGGESQICQKRARGATFGPVRLEKIEYEFEGGRFVGVALIVKDRSDFLAAQKELDACFEDPGVLAPASPASESYRWNGKAVCADLHYLGEAFLPALFLSWTPVPGTPGGPAASAEERRLQHRLRLCAIVDEALNRIIVAAENRVSDLDTAYDAAQKPSGGCGSRPDDSPARKQIKREKQTIQSDNQTTGAERERLQKEMDRLRAELDALRAARLAATHSPQPPIS